VIISGGALSAGVRTFDGPQRLGGAVRRSREVILTPSEVQEAARDRRNVTKSGVFVEVCLYWEPSCYIGVWYVVLYYVVYGMWYVVYGFIWYMVYGIWYMDVLCYMDVLWYMDVYGTVYGMVFSNTIPKSGNIRYIYK
jgi:hypothetical protein